MIPQVSLVVQTSLDQSGREFRGSTGRAPCHRGDGSPGQPCRPDQSGREFRESPGRGPCPLTRPSIFRRTKFSRLVWTKRGRKCASPKNMSARWNDQFSSIRYVISLLDTTIGAKPISPECPDPFPQNLFCTPNHNKLQKLKKGSANMPRHVSFHM